MRRKWVSKETWKLEAEDVGGGGWWGGDSDKSRFLFTGVAQISQKRFLLG